jgi:hypothetical protein
MLKKLAAATWPLWYGIPVVVTLAALAFGPGRFQPTLFSVTLMTLAVAVTTVSIASWANRALATCPAEVRP